MENISGLDWSWKELLTPTEQFNRFQKSFVENENDILYCHLNDLNDIHRKFNISTKHKPENYKYNKFNGNNNTFIIDPRNNKIIDNIFIDYTNDGKYLKRTRRIFKQFPKKSTLNKNEHRVCFRVLQHLRKNQILCELDKKIFNDTIEKRTHEYKLFMDFVNEKIVNESFNKNVLQLNNTYKSYLLKESELILTKPNLQFTLQTALPLPWCLDSQYEGKLNNCQIINQEGYLPHYNFIDFQKMKVNWDNILNILPNNNKIKNNIYDDYNIIIPEETLILLLGAYEDIPSGWEFIVEIENVQQDKFLKFHNPLPLRFINYKTNTFVFEQKFKYFLNKSNVFKWLEFSNNELILNDLIYNDIKEINAVNLNMDYKIKKFDDYDINHHNEESDIKSNTVMINCELNNNKNNDIINLLIVNSNIDFCDNKEIPSFINLSTKLEYKIQFGSEIMTKYELIKEWTRQAIIPNSTTKRYHIDVNTFDTILQEQLTLFDIENDLKKLYNRIPSKMIASLQDFLKIVMSLPCSKYLLKYDPNHKTKLMIYKEENEKKIESSTTLSIHSLYKNIMENCNSIQNEIIPISNTVITSLHERYTILPGCFPYWYSTKTASYSNDRNLTIEKYEERKKFLIQNKKKRFKSRKRLKNIMKK